MLEFSEAGSQSERNEHIEHRLTQVMKRYQVPGVSLAVIHEYSVAWSAAYGVLQAGQAAPARPDTLFQACSISKAVTAVAVLRLVQAGTLDLDTDVNQYLRTWKVPANETWQPTVTIRQLLSHTAGINVPWFYGYHREQEVPSLEQILAGERPANSPGIRVSLLPGTRFRYSGGGYCILQQMLCDVRQQRFPDLMRDLVLQPAGMTNSTYEQPLPATHWSNACSGHRASGKPLAGGWHIMPEMAVAGLWTTATELARFSLELQSAYAGRTGQLLSTEMVHLFLSPQVRREPSGFMGLGVWLDGDRDHARFGHPGDNEGFACYWTAWRQGGMGAVIMTNSDAGGELIADVLETIEQAYEWPKGEDLPVAPSPVRAPMINCTGTYQSESGTLCTISQVGNRLSLQLEGQNPGPLTAVTETVYLLQPLDGEIVFLTDPEGMIHRLLLRQDGSELQAHKIS